jgi:hypothetical protein
MASKAIIAYGATVERSLDGSTGWAAIPEVTGVAVPAVETEFQEVTSLDSPNGYKEYIPGLKDAGTIDLPARYTHDGYAQQLADQATGDAIYYRVTMKAAPDQSAGDVFEFQAYPSPRLEAGAVGEVVGMTITLRITGDVTWTEGAA